MEVYESSPNLGPDSWMPVKNLSPAGAQKEKTGSRIRVGSGSHRNKAEGNYPVFKGPRK